MLLQIKLFNIKLKYLRTHLSNELINGWSNK